MRCNKYLSVISLDIDKLQIRSISYRFITVIYIGFCQLYSRISVSNINLLVFQIYSKNISVTGIDFKNLYLRVPVSDIYKFQ